MTNFIPVDHKDSDPAYRAEVRTNVESEVGSQLSNIIDPSEFVGRWLHSFSMVQDHEPEPYEYIADGTLNTPYHEVDKPCAQWQLESNAYFEQTWCDPIPEHGIPDGCWNGETYHCAKTEDGRIVFWNGDGSLVRILTPEAG